MNLRMLSRLMWPLALLVGLVGAAPAPPGGVIDSGGYRVYQGDRALGTETFSFENHGDSLMIISHVAQTLQGPDGDLPIDKQVAVVVRPLDYDLKFYQSRLKIGGRELVRGLWVNDTAFTSYREGGGHGEGDRLVRPPGRMFVVDSQVFVLFDIMCRNLYDRVFDSRPLQVVVLGDRDSVMEITATDLGKETLRWGAKPVVTRKLRFADARTEYLAWIGPDGHMLRLAQPANELRVERDAPPVKPAAKPPRGN
jgi:hypothetical protein